MPWRDTTVTLPSGSVGLRGTSTVGTRDRMMMRGDVPRYLPATEATVSGTVDKDAAQTDRLRTSGMSGTRIILKTADGPLEVYLGPAWFLQEHSVTLSVGDQVTVVGSRVRHGGTEALIAREISFYGTTVALRESGGAPRWIRRKA